MSKLISPLSIAESLTETWSPRVIGEIDDNYIKVAKLLGSFVWHSHDGEDEMFLLLKGCLRIEMELETVTINAGEMYVVPKGVRHNPVAEQECLVMLIERKSTLHTGDVLATKTRSIEDQLRPV